MLFIGDDAGECNGFPVGVMNPYRSFPTAGLLAPLVEPVGGYQTAATLESVAGGG